MGIKYSLPESLTFHHDAIKIELEKVIDCGPPFLCNMLRYHMGWQDEYGHTCSRESGKFIRPTLCLLSCEAVGGDASQILPAAAAVELIHNFSLIHDDIEDDSHERHHRPTVWKLWGQSQAINAGDAMFTLAYLALIRLKQSGIVDKKVIGATEILSQACLELCDGQYLDVEYERRFNVTIEDYLIMAGKKTAALIAAATSLGAYLGSDDSELVDSFYAFGKQLGIAYQIHDDTLGIWATEENTGKSAGDIAQRKKTLPVVYGLQNSKGGERDRLENLYSKKYIEEEDINRITRILERLGARDYAENLVRRYSQKALMHIGATGLDASRQTPLNEVAHFLLEREQ